MENKQPLISILIPTYNRPEYLKECINSVLSQKWFNNDELEIIISDNSTNNDTKIIVEKVIIDNLDKKIIFNKNSLNIGMIWNWNKLLELKTWNYFIFLSDDDKFYNNDSLKILYDNLIQNNVDVCYWKYKTIDIYNNTWIFYAHEKIWENKYYYDNLYEQLKRHSISFWWILYKNFNYIYDKNAWMWGDWEFNINYLVNNKKILLINNYTFLYKIHEQQDSNNFNSLNYLKSSFYIIYKIKLNYIYKLYYYWRHILVSLYMIYIKINFSIIKK